VAAGAVVGAAGAVVGAAAGGAVVGAVVGAAAGAGAQASSAKIRIRYSMENAARPRLLPNLVRSRENIILLRV